MNEVFVQSTTAGVILSMLAYGIGCWIQKKTRSDAANPLLISIVLTIVFLLVMKVDYENYMKSAQYLSYFLTPATVALAIPLYKQLELLKKNAAAILIGSFSGVIASLVSILLLSMLFGFSHELYVTLLPKSITTAIGMGVSEELGGFVTITVAAIVITGIIGNVIAVMMCRILRLKSSIAKGVMIGTASHAIGTVKAMEIGVVEGAVSSLAIVVCGLMTVIAASFFAMLY